MLEHRNPCKWPPIAREREFVYLCIIYLHFQVIPIIRCNRIDRESCATRGNGNDTFWCWVYTTLATQQLAHRPIARRRRRLHRLRAAPGLIILLR